MTEVPHTSGEQDLLCLSDECDLTKLMPFLGGGNMQAITPIFSQFGSVIPMLLLILRTYYYFVHNLDIHPSCVLQD